MGFLDTIVKGRLNAPALVLVYGPDGVGKTTFGADAPNPIFLGAESGTKHMDVHRLPSLNSWPDFLSSINLLVVEKHPYKTLVIDSLDWMEPLVWEHVCKTFGVQSIEAVGGGFGKGYIEAMRLWQGLKNLLSRLQDMTQMNVVLIAHSHVKVFHDPESGLDFDRYQLKMNDKAAALWREYVDAVLFARFDVTVTKGDSKKAKAFGEGERVMFTEWRPAFEAKNRFGLPFKMPLSWSEFEKAVKLHESRSAGDIAKSIVDLIAQLKDDETKHKAAKATEDAGDSVRKLVAIEKRLREIVK